MSGINVVFFDKPPEGLRHKYAVIIARYQDKLLWCRHEDRNTWEIPGGHIEPGETALQAAARELQEETGATEFALTPICWYSAYRSDSVPHSLGLLCVAEVTVLGELHSEIAEVLPFSTPPNTMTYPEIQPSLLAEACNRGMI